MRNVPLFGEALTNRSGSASPDSRLDQGGGWEPDDDDSEPPVEARARKRRDL